METNQNSEKLEAAIRISKSAAEMADRLKTLMLSHSRYLPSVGSKKGIVEEWGNEGHYWMESLVNYFNNVDAVDDEDPRDISWRESFELARRYFPLESDDPAANHPELPGISQEGGQ